jgi:uncharacterized protein involved in propanediol utilization
MTQYPEPKNGNRLPAKVGVGRSIAQHGELFQGQIEDDQNRLRRCLVSLPCKQMYSRAEFHPSDGGGLHVHPAHKQKALKVVELTMAHLSVPGASGAVVLESTIPEAKGYGSSTADCIAAAIAAADSLGRHLSDEEIAQLVVAAELASDNFMFRRAVLFGHREGVVLEDFSRNLPNFEVLGVDTTPEGHVETLKYPPAEYSWRQLQSFLTLRAALRRGICRNDIALVARVATASAYINEQFLPKRYFKEICSIVEHSRALGLAVAHSGTVLSILLDPQDELLERKVDQIRTCLDGLGISQVLRFQT